MKSKGIWDPETRIWDPESFCNLLGIWDPETRIIDHLDPMKSKGIWEPDPGFWTLLLSTGPRIWVYLQT